VASGELTSVAHVEDVEAELLPGFDRDGKARTVVARSRRERMRAGNAMACVERLRKGTSPQ
jgi:hypothetical protein